MIEYVQAFSEEDAGRFLVGKGSLARPITRRFEHRLIWIGLTWGRPSPVTRYRGPRLVERFVDVNPDEYPGFTFSGAMAPVQATRIARFIERFAKHPKPWAVLVHCARGVSRSGAVAEWVFERYRPMPGDEYERLHPHILPNPYVMRLLREAAEPP